MRHRTRSTMVRSRRGVAGLALMLSLLGACSGSADPQGSPDSISGSRAPVAEPTGGGPTAKTPETPETPETLGDERGVYLMDPATGAVEQISSTVGEVIGPEMSPDGSLLVYQSRAPDGTPQIFVQEAGGTEQQLTDFPAGARDPTWSPNGKRIAFAARSGDDNTDIFVMDADGGRIRRYVQTPGDDRYPDWSPDGSRIAFDTADLNWSGWRIEMMTIADGSLRHLTPWRGASYEAPAWSPDGRWIAYTRFPLGTLNGRIPYADLWIMRADGTEKRPLAASRTRWNAWELDPSWSPDGRYVAVSGIGPNIGIVDVRTDTIDLLPTSIALHGLSWSIEGILGCSGCARDLSSLSGYPVNDH